MTGKIVFEVIRNENLNNGNYKYTIERLDRLGLSSGVYFYKLEVQDSEFGNTLFTETKRMVCIK